MNVHELTRAQLTELKQNYLYEKMDQEGQSPSYGELAEVDKLVSDDEIYGYYEGTDFCTDDFSSTAGEDSTRDIVVNKLVEALTSFFEERYYLGKDEIFEILNSDGTEMWFNKIHELAMKERL